MKTRHSTIIAKAHSLVTKSEPRLVRIPIKPAPAGELTPSQYYLPWERTREQEDIISDQIFAAEETAEKERRDFKTRKEQRYRELGVTPPPRSPSPPPRPPRERRQQAEPEREPEPESRPDKTTAGELKPPPQDTNQDSGAEALVKGRADQHEKDHDENVDEMMQDEEDMVIY